MSMKQLNIIIMILTESSNLLILSKHFLKCVCRRLGLFECTSMSNKSSLDIK